MSDVLAQIRELRSAVDQSRSTIDGLVASSGLEKALFDRIQVGVDALRRDYYDSKSSVKGDDELPTALSSRATEALARTSISVGQDALIATPHGFLLAPAEDQALMAGLRQNVGVPEKGPVEVLVALLQHGHRVIDAGAKIGLLTLPAAWSVGPVGHVIALEPSSRVSALLRQTIAMNFEAGRVRLHVCAAGSKAGRIRLNSELSTDHSSQLEAAERQSAEEVDVAPLDALTAPGQRVDLVRIDAEGRELEVWRGMGRIIADNASLAVMVEFGPERLRGAGTKIDDLLAEIRQKGFDIYHIDDDSGRLSPLLSRADLETFASSNLLLLRQPASFYPQLRFA